MFRSVEQNSFKSWSNFALLCLVEEAAECQEGCVWYLLSVHRDGDGAQGQHVGGGAGGGRVRRGGGRRRPGAAGARPAAAAERPPPATTRRDQHQHYYDQRATRIRGITRKARVRRERRGARFVREVLPARRGQVASQTQDPRHPPDHRAALQADAQIPGQRSARSHPGSDVMAAVRWFRAQPGFGRRGDLSGQADATPAHLRLVPAVPGHFARRRRVARLIAGVVARAPRRLAPSISPINVKPHFHCRESFVCLVCSTLYNPLTYRYYYN